MCKDCGDEIYKGVHNPDEYGTCLECGRENVHMHTILCSDMYTCSECGETLTEEQVESIRWTDYFKHADYAWRPIDDFSHSYGCACGEDGYLYDTHCRLCSDPDATVCYLCGTSLESLEIEGM